MLGDAESSPEREALESDARVHRIGAWLIFAALFLGVLLPTKYSLFVFAFPFGGVALALYYVRFRAIANLEVGLTFLAVLIALQAGAILKVRFDRADAYRQIEDLACHSDFAERAGDGLCDEVYAVLYPEPIDAPEY